MKSFITFIVALLILFSACKHRFRQSKDETTVNRITLVVNYYESGKIESKGAVIDSLKIGYWVYFDENGKVNAEITYWQDKFHGVAITYWNNGNLKRKAHFKLNKLDGENLNYYLNGKLEGRSFFKEDISTGIWEFYTEEGILDKKILYDMDTIREILLDNHIFPLPPPISK